MASSWSQDSMALLESVFDVWDVLQDVAGDKRSMLEGGNVKRVISSQRGPRNRMNPGVRD
jgi:hypothetical protein